jgi:hypothetical protein
MRASGEWRALPCGSAAPPTERDYPLAKGSNNTHTHAIHVRSRSIHTPNIGGPLEVPNPAATQIHPHRDVHCQLVRAESALRQRKYQCSPKVPT